MKFTFSLFETFVQSTMKFYLFLLLWILALPRTQSVTYLRPKNDRGPGTRCLKCLNLQMIFTSTLLYYKGAMRAGIECLEHVERHYFKNSYSQQIQNIGVFHSKGMQSPAMEIEVEYLFGLHSRVLYQEDDEETFQLKVFSERSTKESIVDMTFVDISLADFYVIIADKLDTVSYCKTFRDYFTFIFTFRFTKA